MKKNFKAVATMKANVNSFAKSHGEGQLFPYDLFEKNFFEKLKANNLYEEFEKTVCKELGVSETKCYNDGFYVWYEEPCYVSDKEIDDAIAALVKAKEDLLTAEDKLRLAEDKAKAITIRKLTKNAPTVKEMFDELKN